MADYRQREISEQDWHAAFDREPTGFIAKHWHGLYSLGFSYWIVGVVLAAVVAIVTEMLIGVAYDHSLGLRGSGVLILSTYTILVAITIWQEIGIWRAATNHRHRTGRRFWAGAAKVMVVLTLLRFSSSFTSVDAHILLEGFKFMAGIEEVEPHRIRLLENGTQLEISGGLPFGTADEVKMALDAVPNVQVVRLNSQGGRLNEAAAISRLIRQRQLVTYTTQDCTSACVVAFLAGRERYLGPNARLGFHSSSIGGLDGAAILDINEGFRKLLREHGVPEYFIDRALSTPSSEMWYPSHEELVDAGLIDGVLEIERDVPAAPGGNVLWVSL